MAIEHATTVLTKEFAWLHNLVEAKARLRSDLVVVLVEGKCKGPGGRVDRLCGYKQSTGPSLSLA